ncbi:UTP--glucose-1-phosphate uridylyltransferase [Sphingomonas astaxanthinifaciens]|uniref:UTP--glucose-1-phosphate uridylyltransferase n=1 Tax=Sphingomonas astaxanthinifaciens DSM 22298 TaxID=1123267 RepID=A0ABQ5Z1F7_9SPHN|nr:UTP--glucose-1-phosphate uridylyltransferase [Sphingomonas astaxanthinifaciens]GLR46589.1 UTP--glucose-1-phosphate uridylyltransferase [Sphingomonas astaxanthinifaciens DSM 22298]
MNSSFKPVRKAVFPVAGLGTRLLPATKTMPKEMLTVIDRPLIQYAVDEAREAGIEQLIFVTGRGKSSLVDYFDMSFELETTMKSKGKSLAPLELSRTAFGELITVRQQQPLGLGHAVWCARHVVGDEPFAVLLPDDLMAGAPGALAQMVEAYNLVGGNIVCAEEVAPEKTASYGIVTPGTTDGKLTEVKGLVEKPRPEVAPSRLGVIGRYILQPEVMQVLDAQEPGAGGEIQLTDAMAKLIGRQPFHAVEVDAERHDCGDRAGYVLATLKLAMARDDLAPLVREAMAGL